MTNSTLAAVASAAADAGSRPDAPTGGSKPAPLTLESLRADHGDLVQAIEKDAKAAGAAAERERIAGVLSYLGRGHDDTILALAKDGKSTKADAAVAILDQTPAASADVEKGLKALDRAAEGVESRPSADGTGGAAQPKASTPDGWKAEWEASDKLQAEYLTAESYIAIKKREAAKAA